MYSKSQQTRGKKAKVKKKPTKTQLNKKADTEWSLSVKEKAGFKCEVCGSTQSLNSHHIFGRKNYSTRWDIDNGICLCVGHHKFNPKFSAHESPTLFTDWVKQYRGLEWYEKLRAKAISIKSE
jgi:predicted restriction endonuclease